MTATAFDTSTSFMPDGWTAAYARLHRAGRADFPPACLFYVLNVVRHASQAAGLLQAGAGEAPRVEAPGPADNPSAGGPAVEGVARVGAATPAGSVSPASLIAAFRTATRRDFGPFRENVLTDWGLVSPAELGRAVAMLGHAGCLTLEKGDAPEHYAIDTLSFTGDAT